MTGAFKAYEAQAFKTANSSIGATRAYAFRARALVEAWWWLDEKFSDEKKCPAAEAWETLRRTKLYRPLYQNFRTQKAMTVSQVEETAMLRFSRNSFSPKAIGSCLFDFMAQGFDSNLTWLELSEEQRCRARGIVREGEQQIVITQPRLLPRQDVTRPKLAIGTVRLDRDGDGHLVLKGVKLGIFKLKEIGQQDGKQRLPFTLPGSFRVVRFDTRGAREALLAEFDREVRHITRAVEAITASELRDWARKPAHPSPAPNQTKWWCLPPKTQHSHCSRCAATTRYVHSAFHLPCLRVTGIRRYARKADGDIFWIAKWVPALRCLAAMKRFVLLMGILAMASSSPHAQGDELPRIYIPPLIGNKTEIKGWRDDMGDDLAVLIAHEFARRKLADSQAMTKRDSQRSVDCILLGSVSRFGVNINNSTQSSSLDESSGNRSLWIYWHLIDLTADGRDVVAGEGLAKGRSERGERMTIKEKDYVPGTTIRLDNLNFAKSSLGIATFEAVSNLVNAVQDKLPRKDAIARRRAAPRVSATPVAVQSPVPSAPPVVESRPAPVLTAQVPVVEEKSVIVGKVLEGSSADLVMLNKGKRDGIKKGSKFFLEDNGVSKGQGEITDVEVESAFGRLTSGTEIKTGWSVKIVVN